MRLPRLSAAGACAATSTALFVRFGLLSAAGALGGALLYTKLGPGTLTRVLGCLLLFDAPLRSSLAGRLAGDRMARSWRYLAWCPVSSAASPATRAAFARRPRRSASRPCDSSQQRPPSACLLTPPERRSTCGTLGRCCSHSRRPSSSLRLASSLAPSLASGSCSDCRRDVSRTCYRCGHWRTGNLVAGGSVLTGSRILRSHLLANGCPAGWPATNAAVETTE